MHYLIPVLVFFVQYLDFSKATSDDATKLCLFYAGTDMAEKVVTYLPWSGWNCDPGPPTDPCTSTTHWTGITCSEGAVTAVSLPFTELGFHIEGNWTTDSLEKITSLTIINLNDHRLKDQLPSFSSLQSLSKIIIGNNNFEGTVPDTFQSLTSLTTIDINNNNFDGELTPHSTKLVMLHAQGNQFSIFTPPSSGFTETNSMLDISNNKITGTIPNDVVSKYTGLTEFKVNDNLFRYGRIANHLFHYFFLRDTDSPPLSQWHFTLRPRTTEQPANCRFFEQRILWHCSIFILHAL